jgi:hypothetical protein
MMGLIIENHLNFVFGALELNESKASKHITT